jgi:hypothetical protein
MDAFDCILLANIAFDLSVVSRRALKGLGNGDKAFGTWSLADAASPTSDIARRYQRSAGPAFVVHDFASGDISSSNGTENEPSMQGLTAGSAIALLCGRKKTSGDEWTKMPGRRSC